MYNTKVASDNDDYNLSKFCGSLAQLASNVKRIATIGKPQRHEYEHLCELEEFTLPTSTKQYWYGSLAQLVEHMTFNHGVPGSSPG